MPPPNNRPQLDRIEASLAHQHEMLHRLADMQHHQLEMLRAVLTHQTEGMTPAETAQVVGRLSAAAARLEGISAPRPVTPRQESRVMASQNPMKAVPPELTEVITRINAGVVAVAGVVRTLRDQIATSMTAADVADLKAQFEAVAANLEATAADPANPVPAPVFAKPRK